MIKLVREIRDTGEVHVVLSSHLLRDVEECCEDVLILKDGQIAYSCNLEEERSANRKFIELEVMGPIDKYVDGVRRLGCECARHGKRKIKMILPPRIEIKALYELAAEHDIQIRHLDFKKDSLRDIFLKAMEDGRGGL